MARYLVPSRHGGMTVHPFVARANRETDTKLAAGLICECCGRPFSASRPRATNPSHAGACAECSASLG